MAWASPDPHLTLENSAVLLRPLNVETDEEALWQAASLETNGVDLFLYHVGNGPFATKAEFRAYLEKKAGNLREPTLVVHSKRLGRLVGAVSLLNVRPEHGAVEIGSIWYTTSAQKTEVNTNTMYLVFEYVFGALSYRRLEWKCNDRNQDSKRAALRLGFTYEGLFRQHFWDKGINRDTAWYSLLDSEWPSAKTRFETVLGVRPTEASAPSVDQNVDTRADRD